MNKWILVIPVILLLGVTFCFAAEPSVDLDKIVVTPYRLEESSGGNGNNLEVIESSHLEGENDFSLGDSLTSINGIDVVGGGTFGSASEGVYIRGALPRHTAYLFEGIKVYDPSNPSAYYVPSDFLVSGLEKIEIVKSPLSALYGSSPLGGVVSNFVKKPQTKPYIYLELQGGSFYTAREVVELGGKVKNLSYLFNVERLDTKGYSKAKAKNNNPEKDPYQNTNFTFNINYQPTTDLETGIASKVIHSRMKNDDDDDHNGIPEDDKDNISWNNEVVTTAHLKKDFTRFLSYKAQIGYTSIYRKYQDDNDGHLATDNYVRAWYRGTTYQFLNNVEITPFSFYKALLGFDYTKERADSYRYDFSYFYGFGFTSDFPKESTYTKGFFVENIITPIDSLKIDYSYRLEEQPIFKSHPVMKGGINYKIPRINTEIYGSYGEGFKAPSLYQLYDPTRGNVSLKPEESKTWELGLKQPISNKFFLTFSYFHSDFKNLIDFVYSDPVFWIGQYVNAAKANSRGFEIGADFKLTEELTLKGGYTNLKAKQDFVDTDFVTIFSNRTLRIPKNKAFFGLNFKTKKIEFLFDLSYIGNRIDRIWKAEGFMDVDEFVKLKPYLLGNISINYNLRDNFTIFLKIDNILNKDYERIKGYQEEREAVYAGLKAKF